MLCLAVGYVRPAALTAEVKQIKTEWNTMEHQNFLPSGRTNTTLQRRSQCQPMSENVMFWSDFPNAIVEKTGKKHDL